MIAVTKCPCARCDDYHLLGYGHFAHGSGFTRAEAERIALLLNQDDVRQDGAVRLTPLPARQT